MKYCDEALGIDVSAATIEELTEEIAAEIRLRWWNCALAEDATLSPQHIAIKRELLNRVDPEGDVDLEGHCENAHRPNMARHATAGAPGRNDLCAT